MYHEEHKPTASGGVQGKDVVRDRKPKAETFQFAMEEDELYDEYDDDIKPNGWW